MAKLKYKAFLLASIRLHRRLIESLVTLRLNSQDFYFQGYISMTHVFFPVFAEHFDDDAEIVPAHDNDEI